MKVYLNSAGRMIAEAETVAEVRKLLKLDTAAVEKARAALAGKRDPKEWHFRGTIRTKTHTCGVKYKYLKHHLKTCPDVLRGEAVPITRLS